MSRAYAKDSSLKGLLNWPHIGYYDRGQYVRCRPCFDLSSKSVMFINTTTKLISCCFNHVCDGKSKKLIGHVTVRHISMVVWANRVVDLISSLLCPCNKCSSIRSWDFVSQSLPLGGVVKHLFLCIYCWFTLNLPLILQPYEKHVMSAL